MVIQFQAVVVQLLQEVLHGPCSPRAMPCSGCMPITTTPTAPPLQHHSLTTARVVACPAHAVMTDVLRPPLSCKRVRKGVFSEAKHALLIHDVDLPRHVFSRHTLSLLLVCERGDELSAQ